MPIKLDIEVGDILLGGKFKNKRTVVKSIGKDELGQPTINGKPLLKFRIEKKLPKEKQSKETRKMKKSELKEMVRSVVRKKLSESSLGRLSNDFMQEVANKTANVFAASFVGGNHEDFYEIREDVKGMLMKYMRGYMRNRDIQESSNAGNYYDKKASSRRQLAKKYHEAKKEHENAIEEYREGLISKKELNEKYKNLVSINKELERASYVGD